MRARGCRAGFLLVLAAVGLAHPVAGAQAPGCETGKAFAGKVYGGDAAALLGDPPRDISGQLPQALIAKLDAALDEILAESGAPAVTAAVAVPGRGRWAASRGLATLSPPQPLLPEARFWWASVGKAFTVATVLSLIEDGKLAGSDRLARWYPRYPNAQQITIEQMMTHTSGIGSFPDPGEDFRKAMEYLSPEELIRRTADRGGVIACPGERWSYSNTAMVMLGRIIERIEGRPFHEVVAARVIGPLGLARMIAAPPRPDLADVPREHINREPLPAFNAMTYSAGNIVASAEDMVSFWHALLGGRVLPQAVIRQSLGALYPLERSSMSPTFRTDTYFGRGIMLFETYPAANEAPRHWLGHVGGGFGSTGLVFQEVESGIFVAIAFNAQVDRVAAAEKLLKIVRPDARAAEAAGSATRRLIYEFNVMSPTRDGTLLANDIVRPAAPGRYPVLFFRTPYGKTRLGYEAAAWWAERGYAVVTQDTRGRYDSDGKWSLLVHEANDGRDSHEWLASQSWSNGRIVTQGASYDGIVQWLAARDPHPALHGMISVVSPADLYRTTSSGGGAFSLAQNTIYASLMDGRVMHDRDLDFITWPAVFAHLPVVDAPSSAGRNVEGYRERVRHPPRPGVWESVSWENCYELWDFPVFNAGGWFDTFNASGGTIDAFLKLRQRSSAAARGGHRLIMGPWAHQFSRPPGEVDF
ncbi:MAG: CocE/NonD family hydrolase, partial [Acidimicrobiia bacterium]